MVHFLKAMFENLFVHHYKRAFMNLSNSCFEVGLNWCALGFAFAFYVFHPNYTQPTWYADNWAADSGYDLIMPVRLLLVIFIFVELLSLLSNIHLSSVTLFRLMHPELSGQNSSLLIPTQHGFSTVSCANYFWLLCCWITIAVASDTLYAYLVLIAIFIYFNSRA